jgi:hypothetical protein
VVFAKLGKILAWHSHVFVKCEELKKKLEIEISVVRNSYTLTKLLKLIMIVTKFVI